MRRKGTITQRSNSASDDSSNPSSAANQPNSCPRKRCNWA
jgi:hypothetical protein